MKLKLEYCGYLLSITLTLILILDAILWIIPGMNPDRNIHLWMIAMVDIVILGSLMMMELRRKNDA